MDGSVFSQEKVEFLGYQISAEGTSPLPNEVEAISSFAKPGTLEELRRFVNILNFYRRFLKNAAITQAPLNKLLHVHVIPKTFQEPDQRFDHVHVDLVGPMVQSQGYSYVMTMVDRFSRWPEVIPIVNMTAETVANTFYTHWISRFGMPKTITTDRGSKFESALFAALTRLIAGKRIHTTLYHPAGNGMIERLHRTIKSVIRCHES